MFLFGMLLFAMILFGQTIGSTTGPIGEPIGGPIGGLTVGSELAAELAAELASMGGFEAILKGQGFSIAVTGMLIVFFALAVISLFIRLLPVVLERLEPILPRLEFHAEPPSAAEQLPTDHEKIVAAIGFVLHLEMEKAANSPK